MVSAIIYAVLPYLLSYQPIYRFVSLITLYLVADRNEIEDLHNLAIIESNWQPRAVSDKGACGPWQQIPKFSKLPTSCERLQRDPVHAAIVALSSYRTMKEYCGSRWLRCYQRGPFHQSNRKFLNKKYLKKLSCKHKNCARSKIRARFKKI